jgi:hypothetical protein
MVEEGQKPQKYTNWVRQGVWYLHYLSIVWKRFKGVILILLLNGQLINNGSMLKLMYEDSYVKVLSV